MRRSIPRQELSLLLRRSADQKRLCNHLPTKRDSISCHVVPQERTHRPGRFPMGITTARYVATLGAWVARSCTSTRSWRRTSLLVPCVANPLVMVGNVPKKRHTRSCGGPSEWCMRLDSSGCLLQCVCAIRMSHTLSY